MARRDYGAGSLYRRSSDGRWFGVAKEGTNTNGKRYRITVSAKTEAECKRRLRDKQLQIERDGLPASGRRATVKSWADQWITMRQNTLRPKAFYAARSAVTVWIVPHLGNLRLEDLTPADLRRLASAHRKAGRSTSTANHTHRVLMSMLRDALVEGHTVPQRIFLVDAPTMAKSDRRAVTPDEAIRLLAIASDLPHGSRWLFAILHGARKGEALGLTWDAVDFDHDRIVLEWQLQPLPYLDRKNHALGFRIPDGFEARHLVDAFHLIRPKSRHGNRVLPMHPAERAALMAWREVAPSNPWGLVWPTTTGRPANDKHDLEEWHAIQCSAAVGHPAGRYYHVHETRNTAATEMKDVGADDHTVITQLGHSSIATSRGYMTESLDRPREVLLAIGERFGLADA